MCSAAPEISLADSFSIGRVIALALVKNYTDNVYHIAPKVYEVQS